MLPALLTAAFAAAPASPDWTTIGDEAARWLSGYLQVDTQNPPGNERAGVDYLAGLLQAEGIPYEIVEMEHGRASLIARVKGSGRQKPLCLLSHVDVVTAEPSRWQHPPLSGAILDGYVWGRGALDMKGMGIVELVTLVQAKRRAVPLDRDLVLLAVADEEVDGKGIDDVIAKKWPEIGCSHLVNEGGMGVKDGFVAGQTVFAISVAEKGALWVRMIASGEPGHGSTPVPGRAPEHLIRALDKLAHRRPKVVWHPALLEAFRRIGAQHGGVVGGILQSEGLVKALLRGRLLGIPTMAAALTNTVNVTGFRGAKQPNVVPSEVEAVLDCRLLPGMTPEQLLAELAGLVGDPAVRFEILSATLANESPWDDPFFAALARRAVEGRDDAVAVPWVSPGYTDSIAVRPLGVRAYGIAPFEVTQQELATMHGDDERVSIRALRDGARILHDAVMDVSTASVAAAPAPPPAPPPSGSR